MYICERCGAPAGASGVACRPCRLRLLEGLLSSPSWVQVARTRTGDLPGESMVDTMLREIRALRDSAP